MNKENEAIFLNAYRAIRETLPEEDGSQAFYGGARAMFVFLTGDWAKPETTTQATTVDDMGSRLSLDPTLERLFRKIALEECAPILTALNKTTKLVEELAAARHGVKEEI